MLPSQRYKQVLIQNQFEPDLSQQNALKILDTLYEELIDKQNQSLMTRLLSFIQVEENDTKGCYLWGGVGRGKTFLMDIFYNELPFKTKKRVHFHRFMQDVHHRLNETKLTKNPLQIIAKELSKEITVLCLDEFMVHDIGDAMILSELLASMQSQGIILLTTSNSVPENLYKNGLQRARFLKTIDHINMHCHIVNIDSGTDYRTAEELFHRVFFKGNLAENIHRIEIWLEQHQFETIALNSTIVIQSREVAFIGQYKQGVWFDFESICKTNRSKTDYIELSQKYNAIIVSGLHQMEDKTNDVLRRFITLVDVFYDAKTVLVLGSDVDIETLYVGQYLEFEFERTKSRLYEMQSEKYLESNQVMSALD